MYNYHTKFPTPTICPTCIEELRAAISKKAHALDLPSPIEVKLNRYLSVVIVQQPADRPDLIWTFEELGFSEAC